MNNHVPITDGVETLGTASKYWGNIYTYLVTVKPATELTIASGVITITQSLHKVDTEGEVATDNLDTINGYADGKLLFLAAEHTDRTIVIKHGTGNIVTPDGSDYSIDDTNKIVLLLYHNTKWHLIAAGGGGGGAATFLELTDTPSSYSGQALKYLRVNTGATAIEFIAATIPGSYTTKSGTFTGFTAAETKTLDITGAPGNSMRVKGGKLYISNDPTADENISCRLSFYTKDTKSEADLITDFYFNVTYTEIKTANWSATDTSGDVNTTDGLVKYDLIRATGGTAENIRITAVTDSDTLVFTALTNAHNIGTGVVKVIELPDFDLEDADTSTEIHAKLEIFSAPTASTNIYLEIYCLALG